MDTTDEAIKEVILKHVVSFSDRSEPMLSEIEDRWNMLNQAFGRIASMHRYAGRFGVLYDQLAKLSGEQSALGSVDTFEEVLGKLDTLIESTRQVDELIASLFKLLAEIEVDCFERLRSRTKAMITISE